MHYAFPFLPLEVQTSIKELIALGAPAGAIDLLIDRTSKAIEARTTSAQRDVIEIGEQADRRVDALANQFEDRVRLALGDTNGMIADVHSAVQTQEAAVRGLREEFQRFGEDMSERIGGLEKRMAASERDRKEIRNEIRVLNGRHGTQIEAIDERLRAIEELLALSGNHEVGS
jgi:hypothetical protein